MNTNKINTNGTFHFHPGDKIYESHFPGNPVVPGSIIVEAFCRAIEEHVTKTENLIIENFRFKIFISPGKYRYSITGENNVLKCILYMNEKPAATGGIIL